MIGKTFSHYRIVGRIGAGGMGEVYKAEDLELSRPVALKFLSREMTRNKTFAKRFMREAQAASALDHPNVCTIYEIKETHDGRMFIAMAYYEGKTVQARVADGPLALDDAVAYALGVADGLDQAHRKGIVHRDIKPGNIMVTNDGVVKILDFGLAKLTGRSKVTTSSKTMGTLSYMSPEQTQGKTIDHRSDIFSLGVTLYEMITGESPFLADNEAAVVYQILNVDPRPIRQIRSSVPERLERVVSKAMAKHPNERYQNVGDLRDDLLDVLRKIAPSRAVRFESLRRAGARRARKGARYAFLVVLGLAVVVALASTRDAIRDLLGFGGPGETAGVAVFPLTAKTTDHEGALLASGLAAELTSRVKRVAKLDPELWVVPQDRVKAAAVTDPSQARDGLGVDVVLTGVIEEAPQGLKLELSVSNAKTMRPIDTIELKTTAERWHVDLNRWIARALGVKADNTQVDALAQADTRSSNAYEDVLLGLGCLSSSSEAATDSAIAAFDQAILRDSLFADAHLYRASALFRRVTGTKDSLWADEALASCGRALRLDSLREDAWVWSGRIRASLGDKERAIEAYARAVEVNARDIAARRNIGRTYLTGGQYDKAEEAYRAAIAANPRYYGGYEDLGYLYHVTGKYDEAVAEFERAAVLAPRHAPTYYYLGALFFVLDRWEEAIAMFEKSFSLQKTYVASANLGMMYYMKGRFGDAARMYEWAWEYDRTNYQVIGNLATAYYWVPEERERAMPLFEKAIELARQKLAQKPNDAVLLSLLGGYYSIEHPDSAVRYTEKALALDPGSSEVLFRSAAVYEQIGEREKALVLLGDAMEKGYSSKIIAHERQFLDLRKDPRYELLVARTTKPEGN
jgi:serine/threonine-protein kinase